MNVKHKINLEELTDKEFEMWLNGIEVGFYHAKKTLIIFFVIIIILLIIFN